MATMESSSTAKAGLTLGVIGTALGVLGPALANGSGLLGWGNRTTTNEILNDTGLTKINELQSQVAQLTSQQYTDNKVQDIYSKSAADDKEVRQDFNSALAPIASSISDLQARTLVLEKETQCHQEKAELQMQLMEAKTDSKINQVSSMANQGLAMLGQTIACMQKTLSGITATYVPAASITPAPMPEYNSWTTPTATTTASTGS